MHDGRLCSVVCVRSLPEGTAEDLLKSCHLVCTTLIGHDLNSLTKALAGLQERGQMGAYMRRHTDMQTFKCRARFMVDHGGGGLGVYREEG